MKTFPYIVILTLLIGLTSPVAVKEIKAQDISQYSNIVEINHNQSHVYISNNSDEQLVKIDSGNDKHICIAHDADGKLVNIQNGFAHVLINLPSIFGTDDNDDCPTPSEQPESSPSPTPSVCPSQTPQPTPSQTPCTCNVPTSITNINVTNSPSATPTETPSATPSTTPSASPTPTIDPIDPPQAGGNHSGDVLAASTMAPTGNALLNLALILMLSGTGLLSIQALRFLKNRKHLLQIR